MATKTTTVRPARTPNSARKGGPRPIRSVAELKSNLLQTALAKEMKRIDRKLSRLQAQRAKAHAKANACTRSMGGMAAISEGAG
jgi:hypothetical protein